MTSHATAASVVSSRRNSAVTLSRSLKVGTTTESCGKPVVSGGFSGPGLMASFMPPAYIRSLRRCQGAVPQSGGQDPVPGPLGGARPLVEQDRGWEGGNRGQNRP